MKPRHEKTCFCICENNNADQRICFCFIDSIIPLLAKTEISNPKLVSVAVLPGLCLTWSETPYPGFLMTRLNETVDLETDIMSKMGQNSKTRMV